MSTVCTALKWFQFMSCTFSDRNTNIDICVFYCCYQHLLLSLLVKVHHLLSGLGLFFSPFIHLRTKPIMPFSKYNFAKNILFICCRILVLSPSFRNMHAQKIYIFEVLGPSGHGHYHMIVMRMGVGMTKRTSVFSGNWWSSIKSWQQVEARQTEPERQNHAWVR